LGFPLELLGQRPQPLDLCPGLLPLLVRLQPFCRHRRGWASWSPPSRELQCLQRSGCLHRRRLWVALFDGGGPFPRQLCPSGCCGANPSRCGLGRRHRRGCCRHRCGGDSGGGDCGRRCGRSIRGGGHRGRDDRGRDTGWRHDWPGWGRDSLCPCSFRCLFAAAFLSPGLVTFGVSQMCNGPETNISGPWALHVPPFASQEAGDPICAVFPGHMGLPRPQILICRFPPTARPLHFHVGVWVNRREFPGDLAAASLARGQYQTLVERPGFSEVRLVWQPGVVGPQVNDEVLHRLQPVGPLILREPRFPGFFIGEVAVSRNPFPTQIA
jgi:hypothetical protein